MNFKLNYLVIAALLVTGLAPDAEARSKKKHKQGQSVEEILADTDCSGPKPRVAVYSFYATGKLGAFEGYNVGEGLAAQMATVLQQTGCFIVLDRTGLANVLREQEMTLAGVVNRETGPRAGALVGAEILIKGAVTEYEPNKRGRGINVGFGLKNVPVGVRLGRKKSTAHVALDLSIIDATTGHVKSSHRVEAESVSGGWTLGLDHKTLSLGTDSFGKSPLGIASRNALGKAVKKIIAGLQGIEWRGQVVEADGDTLYLNAGIDTGIKTGDTYRVSSVIRTLVDPGTGLVLDRVEREVGIVRILDVTERFSTAERIGAFKIKRGDFIHL